jgi:co-chaperonin GroES (HSP10)
MTILIPTADEMPADMRPAAARRLMVKPKLPEIRSEDIPEPLGWRVIVLPVAIPNETESGFVLAADTVRHMNLSRRVGVVLKIGALAFSERRGFPPGYVLPINVGDWVNFHESAGVDALMRGRDGDMVSIKFLVEGDLLGKVPNPEAFMVMI